LILVELLETNEIDLGNRRALLDDDDDDFAIGLYPDVLEETGREQRLDRLRGLVIGHRLADLDRQVAENGTGFDALNALEADVPDRKRIHGRRSGDKKSRHQTCEQVFLHKLSRKTID
jgi:hypothetical protein